jgi:hypothetical protein
MNPENLVRANLLGDLCLLAMPEAAMHNTQE